MKEGCGRINKHTHSMKLIYKKKSHIKCDFFVYFKKKQYLCRRVSDVCCEFLLASPLQRRDVAQPGSATVWGTGGRKFKSCHPDK